MKKHENQTYTPRYVLRRVIWEDRWREQCDELVRLCQEVPIEEVLLLDQSHGLAIAPSPLETHRRMAAIYAQIKQRLDAVGIVMSVNIATVVGHGDCALPDHHVFPYQKFVGDDLRECRSAYCILDPAWQQYAAEVCRLYATSGPVRLMVDDDFRSLNHNRWFGCFCPLHLAATVQQLGKMIDVQTLLASFHQQDQDARAIRSAWMRGNFLGQLKAAKTIERAVHAENEQIRLGLMMSTEPQQAMQGRGIAELLAAFAGPNHTPLCRPHGGAYDDALHEHVVECHQFPAMSKSVLHPDTEIISEVECYPHTAFNKSLRITGLQMKLHALCGVDAWTLNIYDYMATPFDDRPQIAEFLKSLKPELIRIAKQARPLQPTGVGLPWKVKGTLFRTIVGNNLRTLAPPRLLDNVLPLMGIPTQFGIGPVNCLSGLESEAFDDAELRAMLGGGLMLDSEACKVLLRRGFGEYLPCQRHHKLNLPSVERIIEGPLATGIVNRLMPLCRHDLEGVFGCQLDVWEPVAGATIHTVIQDLDGKIQGHGILSGANTLGGRVVVISDPPIRRGPKDRLTWLTHAKSELIGRLVDWLYGESPWIRLTGASNATAFLYLDHSKQNGLLAVVNVGLDPVTPTIRCHSSWNNVIRSLGQSAFQVEPLSMRLIELTSDIHRHE